MKIRTGFVSNSSSSSFTCNVCDNTQSGWDMCLSEACMVECRNGHVFCEDHLVKPVWFGGYNTIVNKEGKNDYEDMDIMADEERDFDDYDDGRYNILPVSCPVCSLVDIPTDAMCKFLLWKSSMTYKEAENDFRQQFESMEDFDMQMKKKLN